MKRLLVLLALLAACKKSTPPEDPAHTGKTYDERQACTADVDCVAVDIECCDWCNGGRAVGVHRDFAAEVRSNYVPPHECQRIACTEKACVAPAPFCSNQVCGLRFGNRVQVDPLPP
jgi:hypothetical protein